jgi:anti-sigma regulatory factor (Ser/Thr protein kinase)
MCRQCLVLVTRKELLPVAPDEAVAYKPAQRHAETWPLMSHQELAALPTAASCARRHAKAIVLEWGLPTLADNTALVVSELVTNAVRASDYLCSSGSATPVVHLCLASDLHCVLVRVWDGNSLLPIRRDATPDDDSGRGLMIVEYLSSEWGAYRKADGKVVWVLL